MPGSFTDWAENKMLDHIFGGVNFPCPSIHVGYTLTASGENAPGTEPVGSNYFRPPAGSEFWEESTDLKTTNVIDIICPRSSGAQGNVVGLSIWDSSAGGNQISYIPLDGSIVIYTNDSLVIPAGSIIHEFLPGGMSAWLKNAILNHIYKGIYLPLEPILYAGWFSPTPTDAAPGTEPGAGSYARVSKNNNLGTFSAASGGSKTVTVDLEFPQATAPQGSANWLGWWNMPSGGQYLGAGQIRQPTQVNALDELIIDAHQVTFTLD